VSLINFDLRIMPWFRTKWVWHVISELLTKKTKTNYLVNRKWLIYNVSTFTGGGGCWGLLRISDLACSVDLAATATTRLFWLCDDRSAAVVRSLPRESARIRRRTSRGVSRWTHTVSSATVVCGMRRRNARGMGDSMWEYAVSGHTATRFAWEIASPEGTEESRGVRE
jgi:hypothetical protein